MTKTDIQLKQDIEAELLWDPQVNAAQIGVSVEHGAVALSGQVDSYASRWAAEDATKRVSGVLSVSSGLGVNVRPEHQRSDSEIAATANSALDWDIFVPTGVTAKVERGWVTLEGQVHWNYQRHSAERAVRHLMGVTGVFDSILLVPQASASEVKEKVESALKRQAKVDAKSIHVDTAGGKVTLSGHASSWRSIDDAKNAAWAAPGVTSVVDEVRISTTP